MKKIVIGVALFVMAHTKGSISSSRPKTPTKVFIDDVEFVKEVVINRDGEVVTRYSKVDKDDLIGQEKEIIESPSYGRYRGGIKTPGRGSGSSMNIPYVPQNLITLPTKTAQLASNLRPAETQNENYPDPIPVSPVSNLRKNTFDNEKIDQEIGYQDIFPNTPLEKKVSMA